MGLWDPIKNEGGAAPAPAPTGGLWSSLNASKSTQPPVISTQNQPNPTSLWGNLQSATPTPQLSPVNPQPPTPTPDVGFFNKVKDFIGGLFGKKEVIPTPTTFKPTFTETKPQIEVPTGLKYGDTFKGSDGNMYKVAPPSLESNLPKTTKLAQPINLNVAGGTPEQVSPDFVGPLNGTTYQRPAFEKKGTEMPVPFGFLGASLAGLGTGLIESVPRIITTQLANFSRARGKDTNLLFDVSRLGYDQTGNKVPTSGERYVNDKGVQAFADDPSLKNLPLAVKGAIATVGMDILDVVGAGDIVKNIATAVEKNVAVPEVEHIAAWKGLGMPQTVDEAKSTARQLLVQLSGETKGFTDGGKEEAQAIINFQKVIEEQGIPNASPISTTMRKVARALNTPVEDIAKVFQGNESQAPFARIKGLLPGTAIEPGQGPALGLSTQRVKEVGRALADNPNIASEINSLDLNSDQKNAMQLLREGKITPEVLSVLKTIPQQIWDSFPVEKGSLLDKNPITFEGFNDITTNVLSKLEGRTEVSKQFISDLTNDPGLKQVERDTIRKVLDDFGSTVPVQEFANKVHAELVPLESSQSGFATGNGTTVDTKYDHIALPDETRGKIKNYEERIYQSPITTSAGGIHFSNKEFPQYFAHARVEDLPNNTTRRVIELQSDLFQKGRLDNEKFPPVGKLNEPTSLAEARIRKEKEFAQLEPYRNTWQDRIIREEIKRAGEDGIKSLQFPTGETAMKIEGLGNPSRWYEPLGVNKLGSEITPYQLEVGKEIAEENMTRWTITEVLGDGKFRAVKNDYAIHQGYDLGADQLSRIPTNIQETFDISGKVDTENPIYKFYEKEVGRFLKNKYNASLITDKQGVKWFEVNVPEGAGKAPVSAYKKGVGEGTLISKAEAEKLIMQYFSPRDAKVIFTKRLIDGNALGRVDFRKDLITGKLGAVIRMYEENGLVHDTTAYHEAFHGFFKLTVPEVEQKLILNKVKRNIFTAPGRGMKYLEGYTGTAEERAEEWLADDFADFIKNKQEYKGQYKNFFQRLLEKIRQWIRKVSKAQETYDKMASGEKGVNVSTREEIAPASKKVPSDYQKANEAEAERNKIRAKENLATKEATMFAKQEDELGNLLYERDHLEQAVEADPARGLSKFANKNSEIPEVTGSGGKFGTLGDSLATELGFNSSEEARAAYQDYREKVARLDDLNANIRDKREALYNAKRGYKEQKILDRMAEKSTNETDKLRTAESKKQQQLRQMEETQATLKKEQAEQQSLNEKIKAAQLEATKSKSFLAKVSQLWNPIKSVDPETKDILIKWSEDRILAKVAGQETWLEMRQKGPQTMQEINEYENGKNTPYIRVAMDSLGTEAQRAGLEFGWKSDYLPHVYAQGPKAIAKAIVSYLKAQGLADEEIAKYMEGEELPKEKSLRLKLRPNFVKQRVFPTYEAAANYGLTPRFRTPAQLIAHYREALDTAIANRDVLQKLKSAVKILPAEDAPDSWLEVTKRFANEKGYYARPELADLLNGKFRDEENLGIYPRIVKTMGAVSKFMQEVKLSAGVPFTNINYFSIGQAVKMLTTATGEVATGKLASAASSLKSAFSFIRANSNTASAEWFFENREYIARAALEDIDITGNISDYKGLNKSLRDLMPRLDQEQGIWGKTKASLGSGKNLFVRAFEKAFNEKTFASMMSQMNLQTFKDSYDIAIKSGLEEAEAGKFAADTTRAFMGITGEIGRGKTTEDSLSSALFAPRFREGLINTFVESLKGTTYQFRNAAYAKNRSFLVGMAITFALYQLINKKTSGQYTWQNPPGREFSIRYVLPDGSTAYLEFMPSILAFPRNMAEGTIAALHSDWATAGQKYGSIFSMPLKLLTEIFTNSDYYGRQIFKPDESNSQKAGDIAKYVGLQSNHPFIAETANYVAGKEPLYQALSIMLEFPFKFSSMTKEQTSAYYDALTKQQKVRKDAKADIKKIYDSNQELKAEGKTAEANKVYNALNDSQKHVYDQVKADAKRAATLKRKPAIQKVYNDLQNLKEAGRTEEANAIYYGLSNDDQKIYDSIKKQATIDAGL